MLALGIGRDYPCYKQSGRKSSAQTSMFCRVIVATYAQRFETICVSGRPICWTWATRLLQFLQLLQPPLQHLLHLDGVPWLSERSSIQQIGYRRRTLVQDME